MKTLEEIAPRCETCFCYEKETDIVGWCRRYPPQLVYEGDGNFDSTFPSVTPASWCAEWTEKDEVEVH